MPRSTDVCRLYATRARPRRGGPVTPARPSVQPLPGRRSVRHFLERVRAWARGGRSRSLHWRRAAARLDLQLLVSLFSVEITLQIPASCWCQQSDQGLPQKSSHIKKKSGSLTSCCCLFKEQYLKRLPQQEKAAKLNWNILTVADDKRAVVDGSMQQACSAQSYQGFD